MIRGSCLCGGVAFEIDGAPLWSHYCHCSRCRKVSGAAFSAPLFVPAAAFRSVPLRARQPRTETSFPMLSMNSCRLVPALAIVSVE